MSTTETQAANSAPEQTENKWQAFDPALLGSGLFSEPMTIDPKADSFAASQPVPEGDYIATLGPSNDLAVPTLTFKEYPATANKPRQIVFKINATLKLEQFFPVGSRDNAVLEGKIKTFNRSFSTSMRKVNGIPSSDAVTLLQYLGCEIPANVTADVIAMTLKQYLESGQARIGCSVTWKAGWKDGVGTYKGSDGKDYNNQGEFQLVGASRFPKNVDGSPNPEVKLEGRDYVGKAYVDKRLFSLQAAQ